MDADVAAYVLPGSAVDHEARERGCTAYLADRVERMLPEELTVKTCSLQPGEDHRAHTVDLLLDEATGRVLSAETFRSTIRSSARLAYEPVQEFLDGKRDGGAFPPGIAAVLRRLAELAAVLRKARFAAGALDFALPEVHCLLGADGEPEGFEKRGAGEAYHLVEECMLLANKAVAEKLFAAKVPFLSRIHDAPDEEQWEAMGAQLAAMGLPAVQTPRQINRLMASLRGDPREYMAQLAVLRNLNRAVYSEASRPHFGLAFKRYAHFTSPIRRYPDTMVHRLLTIYLGGGASQDKGYYEGECKHASERELVAADAERTSIKYKLVEYMQDKTGQEFDGRVSGVTEWGMYVEIEPSKIEGMVALRSIRSDFFEFDEERYRIVGRRTRKVFRLGDPVRIRVKEANLEQRLLDYELVESAR